MAPAQLLAQVHTHEVTRLPISVSVPGGDLVGWVDGEGPKVLLLHGGPVGYEYLETLAVELLPGFTVAAYQQRGLDPSTNLGPFDAGTQAADSAAVLDVLGWSQAYVIGHSLGGYFALQLARRIPDRLLGVMVVDPPGAVGDGGMEEFWSTQLARLDSAGRTRMAQLEELENLRPLTLEEAHEAGRLIWPTYFADPHKTFPVVLRQNPVTHGPIHAGVLADMPALAAWLPQARVVLEFVHGAASPMPLSASTDTVELLAHADLEVVEGAGHFIWFERPGTIRAALERLVGRASQTSLDDVVDVEGAI
jgi:pimeloyl-ACP methyl ester carboxylesterase